MQKTILLTGATDGIGVETAKLLIAEGHRVLLHGRSTAKLDVARDRLGETADTALLEVYCADLSVLAAVEALAAEVAANHTSLDALINNAGVFEVDNPRRGDGLDLRFIVNTVAPYLLTRRLLPCLRSDSRVVNVSSAAQSPVDLNAFMGKVSLDSRAAYAQSKLALTMWTLHLTRELAEAGPVLVSVNPASLLGSKMVKEAFGIDGSDLSVGADILARAALSEEFADASGTYYDNDAKKFAPAHADALDEAKTQKLMEAIEAILERG